MAGEKPGRKVYELSTLFKKKKKALPEEWRRRGVTSGTQTDVRELPQELSAATVTIAGSWVCGHIFFFLYFVRSLPGSHRPQLVPGQHPASTAPPRWWDPFLFASPLSFLHTWAKSGEGQGSFVVSEPTSHGSG